MNTTANRLRYTVRKQSSGYSGSVKWYVYDTKRQGRVSVHADVTRECAQREADDLNVSDLVRDFADDPRPYDVRRAEAVEAYYQLTGRQI